MHLRSCLSVFALVYQYVEGSCKDRAFLCAKGLNTVSSDVELSKYTCFWQEDVLYTLTNWCVCVPPWTKGLTPPLFPFYTGRGVWPSCPTTRNEAVDKKGKQGLIIPVYLLQLLNTLSNLLV